MQDVVPNDLLRMAVGVTAVAGHAGCGWDQSRGRKSGLQLWIFTTDLITMMQWFLSNIFSWIGFAQKKYLELKFL